MSMDESDLPVRLRLESRRGAARAAISARERLGLPVPQQYRDFAAGKADTPGEVPPFPELRPRRWWQWRQRLRY